MEYTNKKEHDKGILTFTREVTWLPSIETGWGNGYIALPIDHPFAGREYYDIPSIDDQEWTYGQTEEIDGIEYYVFGFDSAHYTQNLKNWPESRVIKTIESYVPIALQAYSV